MKKYIIPIVIASVTLVSCSLDKDPISEFSEKNTEQQSGTGSTIATKADMQTRYEALYTFMRGSGQEFWALDFLQNTETRADNSYAGSISTAEIVQIEQNGQDQTNKNVVRDWKSYLRGINLANVVIANVDKVPDTDLTSLERKQWKAEAKILKAWMLFDMVRFWGDVPLPSLETPEITSDNITETYNLLFPKRSSVLDVYNEIKTNLEEAVNDAPAVNTGNKFLLSRAVANALLAKVYAEKPIRDYNKTIQYCNAVEAEGFQLLANYGDLFEVNDTKTDAKLRNSVESIFEITYSAGGQTWLPGLFGLNHINAKSTYDWAKWVTPSRDLIAAFDAEGDAVRKNQAIVWGQPSWSTYYPSDNYPFMYKIRSGANSIIKLRLADILLLKAEALVATGDLSGAATLVNQIRARVGLAALSSSVTASADAMKTAVLNERRLELAFEGHRWFDLLRNDVAIETMNTLPSRDQKRSLKYPLNEQLLLYPVPQTEIENNPQLTQNPGY